MAGERVVFVSLLVCLLSSYSSQSVINSEFKTELDSGNTDSKLDGVDTNPDQLKRDVISENIDYTSNQGNPVVNPTIPKEKRVEGSDSADKTDIPDDTNVNDKDETVSDFEPSYSDSQDTYLHEGATDSPQAPVDEGETPLHSELGEDSHTKIDTPDIQMAVKPEEPEEDSEPFVEDKAESEDAPAGSQGKTEGIVDTSVRELDPVELTPEDEDMVIMKMRELGGILDEKEIADIIEQEQTVEDVEGDLPEDIEDLRFEPIPMPTDFESYDRNGDGLIEMEELTDVTGAFENVADAFIVCDKNGDGFIDEEEFKAAPWDLSGKPPETVQEQL